MDFKKAPSVNGNALTDNSGTILVARLPIKPPLAMSFSQNGDIYFVAHESMTFTTPTEAGTGTLTYYKAVAATPTTFNTISSWPTSFAVGDILKVNCASISTYKATTLGRSA